MLELSLEGIVIRSPEYVERHDGRVECEMTVRCNRDDGKASVVVVNTREEDMYETIYEENPKRGDIVHIEGIPFTRISNYRDEQTSIQCVRPTSFEITEVASEAPPRPKSTPSA